MPLKFIGIEKLEGQEANIVNDMFSKYLEKLERDLPDCELIVDVKVHNPEGNRKNYGFLCKIVFSGDVLTAQHEDWDLKRCLHRVCGKLINEVQHKFKTEGHLPKN